MVTLGRRANKEPRHKSTSVFRIHSFNFALPGLGQIFIISFPFADQIGEHLYFFKWVLLGTLTGKGDSQ